MTSLEIVPSEAPDFALRQHIEQWLSGSALLADYIAQIDQPAARQRGHPGLIVAASGASDWSGKGFCGCEVQLVLTLTMRSGAEGNFAKILAAIEQRMAQLPEAFSGGQVVTLIRLARRSALTSDGVWRARIGYRARMILDS